MAELYKIVSYLNDLLEAEKIKDLAYNGLQVEGSSKVCKIITGVSANYSLLHAAYKKKADLVITHHGLVFGGINKITGPLRHRLKLLLKNDISLLAYHLPLDMHKECGNNACLAQLFDFESINAFGSYKNQDIGFVIRLKVELSIDEVMAIVTSKINKLARVFPFGTEKIKTIAICSGGASNLIEEAIDCNYDLFLSGEAAEYTPALCREAKIHSISAGHHATERFGIKALGNLISKEFIDCELEFVDIYNDL